MGSALKNQTTKTILSKVHDTVYVISTKSLFRMESKKPPTPLLSPLLSALLKKKCFFGSNAYKIEVMITSLIVMLELSNFGHMNTSTI